MYLQSSQVVVSNLYLGVPTKADITLINGTVLPTRFRWHKVSEPSALEAPGGGMWPLRHLQDRCSASPAQPVLCPQCPEKLGPSKEQHIWSGFSLIRLRGRPVPCLRSLRCTQLDCPARDWSTQLLGAPMRHCPRAGWSPLWLPGATGHIPVPQRQLLSAPHHPSPPGQRI